MAAQKDGWTGLLDGFGIAEHGRELDHFALIAGLVLGPADAQRFGCFAQASPAQPEVGAHDLGFFA